MLGGYAILALVLFRLVWGFIGTRPARFSDFLRGPKAAFTYAGQLFGAQHRPHLGHNPLGGWSVMLMLLSLLTQAVSGLFADDEIMTSGPLEKHVSDEVSSVMTAIHDVSAIVLGALVAVHIAAVLYYLFVRKENLIGPMITGEKVWHEAVAIEPRSRGLLIRALAVLALSGLAVAALVNL
jgi:cytochrome b